MNTPITCLVVLTAVAFRACSPPQGPAPMPLPKVTVVHPQMMTVTNWDEYPGHLEAIEKVEVRPQVSGQIDSIHFRDGADVKAGDLLFVIDPRPYQAELDRAIAELRQAESRLELAKNDFKRAESLHKTNTISEEEFDTRNKAMRGAEAAVAAARAAQELAKVKLDYTKITAFITGRIGDRSVTAGNFVQLQGNGGAAPVLTTIFSLDPIYFIFDVAESDLWKYRSSGKKDAALPCELQLANEQGYPHKGEVDFFNNQVDAKTGTIRLRGVFPNPDRKMLHGMSAKVRVPAGGPVKALAVPAVAIGSDQGMKLVMVVNKEGVVEPRPVEVDRQHGDMRIVTKGVTPEDRVIVNGLMMARPGVKVQIVDTQPSPTAQR